MDIEIRTSEPDVVSAELVPALTRWLDDNNWFYDAITVTDRGE